MNIDNKLNQLREEYKRTTDPLMREDLVKRANRWKMVKESLEKGMSKFQSKYRPLDNSIVDPV